MKSMRPTKKLLALALATILIVMLIPFSAFATTLSATGVIKEIGSNYYSVRVHSTDHIFYITSGTSYSSSFFDVGDTVKIYFEAEEPITATRVVKVSSARPPQHSHYAVTGTVTDAGMSTITVMTQSGSYRTFSKEDATINGAYDGLLLGDVVEVVYAAGNNQRALQINFISMGDNHNSHQHSTPPSDPTHYAVTGVVTDMGMSSITVYRGGTYRTFGIEDARISVRDGVLLGDTVRVIYVKADPSSAIQVVMVTEGDNH